jgi:hypothetical protein
MRLSLVSFALITGLATAAMLCADTAFAKRGRGRGGASDRVKERVDLTVAADSPVTAREARVEIRRRDQDRQRLIVKLDDATRGASLDLFMADSLGDIVRVGDVVERRGGDYRYRVRTKKGQALPFGAADVSSLSGRVIEVRTDVGSLVASGRMPSVDGPAPRAKGPARLSSALSVIGGVGDGGVHADVDVRRKRDGREEFRVEIERAEPGLQLIAFVADAAGVLREIGALTADDDDAGEYELRFRTKDGDALPLGAATVGELAGRALEVRTVDGVVVAVGEIPDAGSDDDGSDDDDSDDDDSADDSDDDE